MAREVSFWAEYGISDLGPDTVFSSVLAPFVMGRLKHPTASPDSLLQRVFNYLEDLSASEEETALSAVYVSFGEELLGDPDVFKLAQGYMGPHLREGFRIMQERLDALPPRGTFR